MTEKAKPSNVNASELRAMFTDYDRPTAPYEGAAMLLTITADIAFVAIGQLTEERGKETFVHDSARTIGVDAEQLYETLGAMLRRDDRHNAERLREGTLPADHPARAAVPVEGLMPGVRRRA
jgi:hypothetical protein